MSRSHRFTPLLLAGLLAGGAGCSTIYYGTMEKLGVHKREILVDRVTKARNSQEESKEQFQTALERFSEVLAFEGGELEAKYKKLSTEFARCEERAQAVHDHIDAVEDVSAALFREWKSELREYTDRDLRRASESMMADTQARYQDLITAMKQVESKMDPVLNAFRDQVLFLKHNLNAQAIAALQDDLSKIESQVADLIRDMESSIREADSFINAMRI